MAWWLDKVPEVQTRLLIALELETGWVSTPDLLDHWLLCPYGDDGNIKRALTALRERKWIESQRGAGRGPWSWRLTDAGLGVARKEV